MQLCHSRVADDSGANLALVCLLVLVASRCQGMMGLGITPMTFNLDWTICYRASYSQLFSLTILANRYAVSCRSASKLGSMGAKDVLLTTVVPCLGGLISLAMYASPVSAVLNASKRGSLGDLNPIPFMVTVANTVVWCSYGLVAHDPFVTAPNASGIVVALFCALTSFGLADEKLRAHLRLLLCTEAAILSLLGVLTSFAADSLAKKVGIWGVAGNVISMVYYAAPLSTMAEVVRSRNAASILPALTIMNTTNAALWTTYGLALQDIYIWLPNGVGLVLSVAQLALWVIFPSRPKAAVPSTPTTLHEASYAHLHPGEEEHAHLRPNSSSGKV